MPTYLLVKTEPKSRWTQSIWFNLSFSRPFLCAILMAIRTIWHFQTFSSKQRIISKPENIYMIQHEQIVNTINFFWNDIKLCNILDYMSASRLYTVLKNRKSLKKKCLGLWLVWSESSHFLVSEMLCHKIFSIWVLEKISN